MEENKKHSEKQNGNGALRERMPLIVAVALVVLLGGAAAGFAYFGVSSRTVYTDKATIQAPEIPLAPTKSDTLKSVFVTPGDLIAPNTVVAQVGTELIKSQVGGLVISTNNNIGALVAAGTPVVTVIDPSTLRVVGEVDENKGLSRIKVGDPVTFSVDAFPGQQFSAVVDEIAPTSNQSGIVFNISSSRATQQFDVKARFDTSAYPQLKNGMSARMTIYVR
jgi:multidrug resistance efflux pump